MKRITRIVSVCCIGMSFFGQAQTSQVHIAGNDYPIVFEDTNLVPTVQQRIAADLALVFSYASSFEKAMGGGDIEATVDLPGGGTDVITENGVEYWDGVSGLNRVSMLRGEKCEGIFLVDYDNQKSIRVSQVASSNYLHAFTLMQTHSNAVKKAYEFVAFLKSPDLASKPLQVLKDLHNTSPEDREDFDEDAYRDFATRLQQNTFSGFSALNFVMLPCPEIGGTEAPVIGLFMANKSDPSFVFGLPILFHNGKWGFGKYW